MISERLCSENFPGKAILTHGEEVCCSEATDTAGLYPCRREEADTRMLLHAADGIKQGCKRIPIRTVDKDVAVLAVSFASKLDCDGLWLAFGTGKSFRYLDARVIAQKLGEDKSDALPAFHALTGGHTTSCFTGKGKCTASSAWNAFSDLTPLLKPEDQIILSRTFQTLRSLCC